MKKLFFLLLPCCFFGQVSTKKEVPFTHKEFKNLVHYFSSKEEMKEYFSFKSGQIIADIGAGSGSYEGAISLLYDSLNFYVQDIDSIYLNKKTFDKTIKHYSKLRGVAQTNTFSLCIGTASTSNWPDNYFDKIITFSTFHEFTFMSEMIADIFKKLKPGGKLYIADASCTKKGHRNYSPEEVTAMVKLQGFQLIKMHLINTNYREPVYRAVFLKPELK